MGKFIERGLTNRAQHWTTGYNADKFTRNQSKGMLDDIQRVGFRLPEEEDS